MYWKQLLLGLVILVSIDIPVLQGKEVVRISDSFEQYDLRNSMSYFIDSSSVLDIDAVMSQSFQQKFIKKENVGKFSLGITEAAVWLKLDIVDNSTIPEWFLEVNYPALNDLEFYFVCDGKIEAVKSSGINNQFAGSQYNVRSPLVSHSFQKNKPYHVYVRVKTYSLMVLPISIMSLDTYFLEQSKEKDLLAVLLGVLFAVFLFNVILFALTKENAYGFLAVSLFFMGIHVLFLTGFTNTYNLGISHSLSVQVRMLAYQLSYIFGALFAITYLELKYYAFTWYQVFYVYIALVLVYMFFTISLGLPLHLLNRIGPLFYPFTIAIFLGSSLTSYLRGHKAAKYYLLAISTFVFGASLYLLMTLGLIPKSYLVEHISLICTTIYALLLTIGLVDKITAINREKDRSRQLAADKYVLEKEVIARQKAEESANSKRLQLEDLNAEILKKSAMLTDAYAKQKELQVFKEDMTNMIVHDLKNFLNILIHTPDSVSAEKQVGIMKESANQMMSLVLNILDVYRFTEGQLQIKKSACSLFEIAQAAMDEVVFLAVKKNIRISNGISPEIGVLVDQDLIMRVFINLLTNSIKYTDNNGEIELCCEVLKVKPEQVMVKVSDNGVGVSADQINRVFDPYSQIKVKKLENIPSSGIGLSFCKLAVEAHEGTISISSVEDRGTTVSFSVPFARVSYRGLVKEKINILDISLVEEEKQELDKIYKELKKLKVNDLSAFRRVFHVLEEENLGNELWRNELKIAVYGCNQKTYDELVSSIKE